MPFDTTPSPQREAPAARQATREPLPFQAEAEAVVARQKAAREARTIGVCWSGMTSPAPVVEDVETGRQRLVEQDERGKAFMLSPLGRFYCAFRELENVGCPEEAYQLEGIYRRSLADQREPLNVRAVGACLAVLEGLPRSVAKDARAALIEMLLQSDRRAA